MLLERLIYLKCTRARKTKGVCVCRRHSVVLLYRLILISPVLDCCCSSFLSPSLADQTSEGKSESQRDAVLTVGKQRGHKMIHVPVSQPCLYKDTSVKSKST